MLQLFDENNEVINTNQPTQFCENPSCLGEPYCSAWGICRDEDLELETDVAELASSAPAPAQPTATASPTPQSEPPPSKKRKFAPIKSDTEVEAARSTGIPQKTLKDTKYCVSLWEAWVSYREQTNDDSIGPIDTLSLNDLQHWLSRFILEVRKKDGSEFTPNSLHHIVCGIMRYLRWKCHPSIDFFTDTTFTEFKRSLDSEMKRLQAKGLGSNKRQAEVLTWEDEEKLWSEGLLGETTPQQLLDTIIFYIGLYFALRSGREHRQLRQQPCQIQLIEADGERSCLKYTEDVSKNRPGGLKGRKMKPKIVTHYANTDQPTRCLVRLFKKYTSLCPEGASAFYLLPSKHPTDKIWYTSKPLGHNTLSKTISRLCKSAGIDGFKTNHSLRATAATRLYESGVDEQIVTGHRSLEGVRSYKRTTNQQKEVISDILNTASSSANATAKSPAQILPVNPCTSAALSISAESQADLPVIPATNTGTTNTMNIQSNTKNSLLPGHAFHFNNCSSVTFNINYSFKKTNLELQHKKTCG